MESIWKENQICFLQVDCLPDKKMLKMKASFSVTFEHQKKFKSHYPNVKYVTHPFSHVSCPFPHEIEFFQVLVKWAIVV